jgi:hypothetical protein
MIKLEKKVKDEKNKEVINMTELGLDDLLKLAEKFSDSDFQEIIDMGYATVSVAIVIIPATILLILLVKSIIKVIKVFKKNDKQLLKDDFELYRYTRRF